MNKKIGIIVAVVLIAFIAVGFMNGFFNSSQDENPNKVTIGHLPSDHDAALFVADRQGYFKEKNIDVELVQFNTGGDLLIAMASGKVDIGYVGISPVLAAVEKDVPIKIISAAQNEGSGIILSKNSKISTAKDLNGKIVATPGEASIQYVLLSYYLNKNGLSMNNLNVSSMKTPSINDAIKTNTIDAGVTFQPFVSSSEANGNKVLATSKDIMPDHPCCVVVATDKMIEKRPDTVRDIVEAHEKATEYINNNTQDNASAVVDLLPDDIVSNDTVEEKSLKSFPFISGLDDGFKAKIDAFMKVEVELGILDKPIPHDKLFWDGK